jgi:hypothetical protein
MEIKLGELKKELVVWQKKSAFFERKMSDQMAANITSILEMEKSRCIVWIEQLSWKGQSLRRQKNWQ